MEIQVGKSYFSRNGRGPYTITRHDPESPLPFLAHDGSGYTHDGRFDLGGESPWDLVEEVTATKK